MRPDWPFRPAALPFYYGWVVLAVGTLGIVLSVPGQTMGVSVFTDALIEATGLTRLEISNAYLLGTLVSGLLLPLGGAWVDRLGARVAVLGACVGLALTLVWLASVDRLAAALAGALPPPVAAWGVLALGFTGIRFTGQGLLTLVSRTMIAHWFERRRGLVSALSGPVVSFSFAGAPLLLALWIGRAGWRGAWLEMALVVGAGMGLLGWLFYRDNPEQCGLRVDGDPPAEQREGGRDAGVPPPVGFTRGEALRTAAFWLVALGLATHAMVGTGITFHIVDLGAEQGLDRTEAVAIFLPIAVVSTLVGFAAGAALDRFPVRAVVAFMMLGQLVMFVGVARLGDPWLHAAGVAGWGVAGGCFGPMTTAALPALFGRAHLGAIQGVMMMCLVIGSALGPSALALFRDVLGAYGPGLDLLCALPLAVLVAAPFTREPRPPAAPRPGPA